MMIELTNIEKTFFKGQSNEVRALRDLTLRIRDGEFVAVTGPSGSGKSTLLHILGGIEKPTSGSYLYNGADMLAERDARLSQLRSGEIGIVMQNYALLGSEDALQNVRLPMIIAGVPGKESRRRAEEALDSVGLGEIKTKRVNLMSGGQQQRVAIARTLAMGAKLILADEPTGALDSQTAESFVELLRELNEKGVTIVLATHNMHVADSCRRKLLLQDGVLVSDSGAAL